ncbi:MAG: hypothetical protein QOH38_2035 [Thermoleophilaceae bacterium]|nr:hypothetical protein [Thermoleophilaceae bacterium]
MAAHSRQTTDVAAVVLTVGEPTTSRALASLRAQTLPVEEPAMVEGVRPFHRALNAGAARVGKPFFLQVDADMVLEPECAGVLRRAMGPDVGIAVGALRDPLTGKIAGVKMYRRECFRHLQLRDTLAPEIDFYMGLAERGWRTACVSGGALGDHRPAYEPEYVFGTFYLLGARYIHREDMGGLGWRLGRLRRSLHPMAPVARIAIGHGVFAREEHDVAKPRPSVADSRFLHELAAAPDGEVPPPSIGHLLALEPRQLVDGFSELGATLRATSHAGLRGCLRHLADIDHESSLLAEVALGHGALAATPAPLPDAILTAIPGLA